MEPEQTPQEPLPLQEAEETEAEKAKRLAEIQHRDKYFKEMFRKGRQQRYLNSFLLFANEILDMGVKQRYFGEISDRLDAFPNKKHLVLGPRASRKTTFFTGKVIHRALKNPNEPTLIFGETKS